MNELFMQGIELTILGMGFVFIFLVLLVFFMNIMSFLVVKYLPEPIEAPKTQKSAKKANLKSNTQKSNANEDEKIAAFTAVTLHHKNRN